jgi:hypothetical protein
MKKQILAFSFVFLFVALLAAPVLADSSNKVPVTFTRTSSFLVVGEHWYSDDNTFHVRGNQIGYHSYIVAGNGINYVGSSAGTMLGNLNLKNSVGHQTFDSQIVFAAGTFEGVLTFKGTFGVVPDTYSVVALRGYMYPIDVTVKGVWHGTGAYTGQTLVMEYDIVNRVTPAPITGYLLIP